MTINAAIPISGVLYLLKSSSCNANVRIFVGFSVCVFYVMRPIVPKCECLFFLSHHLYIFRLYFHGGGE